MAQVTDRSPLDARLYSAESALEELTGTAAHNSDLTDAFGLRTFGDLQVLVRPARLVGSAPPGVHDDWLTITEFAHVENDAQALVRRHLAALSAAQNHVRRRQGSNGPPCPTLPALPALPDPGDLTPAAVSPDDLTAADAHADRAPIRADATLQARRAPPLAWPNAPTGHPRSPPSRTSTPC